jgi:hypothetical protein
MNLDTASGADVYSALVSINLTTALPMLGNGGEGYYNRADAIKGLLALVAEVDTAALRGQLSAHSDPSDGLE